MKRPAKSLFITVLMFLLLSIPAGKGFANVTGFVTRDGLDNYFEYSYESLLESYVLSILGGDGELYRHYSWLKTMAILDDVKGYVDYSDVLEAYAVAVITRKPFDLDIYIANHAKTLMMPPSIHVVTQNGKKLEESEKLLVASPPDGLMLLSGLMADKEGPLPVMTKIRWRAETGEGDGAGVDVKYAWYIYKDNKHWKSIWYQDESHLDFVPTEPGKYRLRVWAVSPEGYAADWYAGEIVMEETVVIEKPALSFRNPLRPILEPIEKLLQHHMAQPSWDVYQVHNFHRNRIHWLDDTTWEYWDGIGYNYWIGFDGTIYETRGRQYGSHAGANWNGRSIGVGYQGDFTYQLMTDQQVMSGAWLNAKLIIDEGLVLKDIWGHKDVSNTACPGKYFRTEDLLRETKNILNSVYGD
jgi:N-acetylmuramoyl-L-alanine amidase